MSSSWLTAPQPVGVTGGSNGIEARCEDIRALAGEFGGAAVDTLHAAFTLHGYLVHPGLTLSVTLDPVGWAEFEADLLEALDGLHGLSWGGAQCGALDGELRLAALAYESVDRLEGLRDEAIGALKLPGALVVAAAVLGATRDPAAAAQAAVADDPQLADTVVDLLGIPAALSVLARTVPDGHAVVRSLGTDARGAAGRAPRRLTDLLLDLDQRNDDTHHGAIDVRILTMPDGTRRAIVDITGTKSWTPLPTADITSLTTNGRALVGVRTAYEQGVLAAMHRAGVRPTDKVMLVGHSEGGMVAVNAARDATASGRFDITHVVTAGAPVGLTVGSVPARVQVLALENTKDVVPHLDGRANPGRRNVTTVSSAHGDGTIVDDHSIGHGYVPLARDTQASKNGSVRHFLAGADGYLRATSVTTHSYQITRGY